MLATAPSHEGMTPGGIADRALRVLSLVAVLPVFLPFAAGKDNYVTGDSDIYVTSTPPHEGQELGCPDWHAGVLAALADACAAADDDPRPRGSGGSLAIACSRLQASHGPRSMQRLPRIQVRIQCVRTL